jgi:tryptophan synthase alpha chain
MNRIERAFKERCGRAVLIPFLNAGDPTFDESLTLFRAVLDAGADMVEIGIPYSDPLADGPVIQASALRSLNQGFHLPRAFELAEKLRKDTDKGLILFSYVNPVLQYTPERFFRDAAAAGVDGIIIPDLPFEESDTIRQVGQAHGIALIPLVAPTSNEERIHRISRAAQGFVYCVSSLGVTGERTRMSEKLQDFVATTRRYSAVPVAVGFGVSTPIQASTVASFADGVIVGSAFIRRIEEGIGQSRRDDIPNVIRGFAAELAEAVR